jgi:hypothetical protein
MTEKKRMALIADTDGKIVSATEGQIIIKFEGSGPDWTEYSRIDYTLDISGSLGNIRSSMKKICDDISDCVAVISTSINGLPYRMFDKAGLKILEVQEFNIDDLEYLEGLINVETYECERTTMTPVSPGCDGNYIFDLVAAQSERPDLSSKMLLRDFLDKTPFVSFVLICEHVPPWIEELVNLNNMDISISKNNEKIKATIRRGCIANNSKR